MMRLMLEFGAMLRRPGCNAKNLSSGWSNQSFLSAVEGRFDAMRRRYEELCEQSIAKGKVLSAVEARELSEAEEMLSTRRDYEATKREASELEKMARDEMDEELRLEAQSELESVVVPRVAQLESELVTKLLPKEPGDESRQALIEVRAAAGGDEASAFARELTSMYSRYASIRSWKWEVLDESRTEFGGLKEALAIISGERAYADLRFESGVHRVQRVPRNDTRIHTSTVTVVVMPHHTDKHSAAPPELPSSEVKIDTFRASGAGGQHVNTTDSAVRATHIPTNTVVSIQDERSQHSNRAKALRILAARVHANKVAEQQAERSSRRAELAGSGDRSERVRTYNFPHDRVVDHRIGHTANSVDRVLSGELLDDIIHLLNARDRHLKIQHFCETAHLA